MTRDLRSIRRELQGKIVTIFAADNPMNGRGGFSPNGFSHYVVDLGPPYFIAIIPTASGENRQPRLSRGSRQQEGAASHDRKGATAVGRVRVRVSCA